ncbi:hypothetical protein BZM26_09950 [Paraburkholderia strydomiana]|nr:hypothetical protein BZM26_09950 [Paraburkholderia strydomiana]
MIDWYMDASCFVQLFLPIAGILLLLVATALWADFHRAKGAEVFDALLDGQMARIEVACRGSVEPDTWVRARVFKAKDSRNSEARRLYAYRQQGSRGDWVFSSSGAKMR